MKTFLRQHHGFSLLAVGLLGLALSIPAFSLEEDRAKAAHELLTEAYGRRHVYGDAFPGFTAELRCQFGAGETSGHVRVTDEGKVEAELEAPEARQWVEEQLSIILSHRLGSKAPEEASLRLLDDDKHPLGRRIAVRDGFGTSYRVGDGHVREVERSTGPIRFVVTILDYVEVIDGKELPRFFTATYFDADSDRLLRSFVFHDAYEKVGAYALPKERVAVAASDGGTYTARFSLSKHKLLEKSESF